jgi:hypothetical protein
MPDPPGSRSAGSREAVTLFAFTPRDGVERLFGPLRSLNVYEAAMEEDFGAWVEQAPVKLRTERYDACGAIRERDRFDETGALAERAVFGYAADGRLVERTHYDTAGLATLRYVYDYDRDGRLAEMSGLDRDGAVRSRLERHYDSHGRLLGLIEQREDDGAAIETRWRVAYGPAGTVEESAGEVVRDGVLVERLSYRYDAAGSVAESARLAPDGEVVARQRFVYGPQRERGNWVRRVTERWLRRFGQDLYQPTLVTYRRFLFHPDVPAQSAGTR